MRYRIAYTEKVTRSVIPSIPAYNREQISRAIDERLTVDPIGLGKPLRYNLKGAWRLRVGNWRVLYRIEGDTVTVFAIDLRRDAY